MLKKCIILIIFDDMIPDMDSNKKRNPIVTEKYITARKLNLFKPQTKHYASFYYENSK